MSLDESYCYWCSGPAFAIVRPIGALGYKFTCRRHLAWACEFLAPNDERWLSPAVVVELLEDRPLRDEATP